MAPFKYYTVSEIFFKENDAREATQEGQEGVPAAEVGPALCQAHLPLGSRTTLGREAVAVRCVNQCDRLSFTYISDMVSDLFSLELPFFCLFDAAVVNCCPNEKTELFIQLQVLF